MFSIISGLPGSGKSTMTRYLKETFGINHISTVVDHTTVEIHAPGDSYYFLINDELKYRLAEKYRGGDFILERGVESTYGYISAHDQIFGTRDIELFEQWKSKHYLELPTPYKFIHFVIDEGLSIHRRYPSGFTGNEGLWTNQNFLRVMEEATVNFIRTTYPKEKVSFIDASKPFSEVKSKVKAILNLE